MARKPKIEEILEPTEEELDLEEFEREIGPGVSVVNIYRVTRSGEQEQLDKISFDEIRNDPYGYLRERFGSGKFRLYFRTPDWTIRKLKTLLVGTQVKAETPVNGSHGNGTDSFLREQMAQQQTLILALIGTLKPATPPDIGAMMQGLGAIMAGAPKQDPVAMFTALVTAFAAMKGPGKDEDWLERAQKIISMAKDLTPESAPDSWLGVVRDVGKEVAGRLVSSSITVMPQPQVNGVPSVNPITQTQVQLPPEAPVAQTLTVNPPTMNRPQNQVDWIRHGLFYLKNKAKLKKETDFYVDLIFENQEEPQWKALIYAIQQGATFSHLLQFDPEIAQNAELKAWFQKLFDDVQSEIATANPTDDSSGPGRNEDHPGTDAAVGAGGLPAAGGSTDSAILSKS